jgi:hypothetical protein
MRTISVKGLCRRLMSREYWEMRKDSSPLEWDHMEVWSFGFWAGSLS